MKTLAFLCTVFMLYFPVVAQIACFTDEYNEELQRQYPATQLIKEHNKWKELLEDYDNSISITYNSIRKFEVVAPVVFHVIRHPQLGIAIDMKPSNKVIVEQLGILEDNLAKKLYSSNSQTDTLAKQYLTSHPTDGIYYERLHNLLPTNKTLLHEEIDFFHNDILPQNNILDWNKLVAYQDNDGCVTHFITTQKFVIAEITAQTATNTQQETDKLLALQNELAALKKKNCSSCVACSPTKGKIEGNNIFCHNEVVTYKFLGGEAYGCSFTWNVIGGTFPDYANGIIASQTYGFPSYTDSIRVRWDGTVPIRELRCLPTKCEVTDDLVLVRPNTFIPTLRATKQVAFVPSSLVVACGVQTFRVELQADAGIKNFVWTLPTGLTQASTGATSFSSTVPYADLQATTGTTVGTIQVTINSECPTYTIQGTVSRRSKAAPELPSPLYFCQVGDIRPTEVVIDVPEAIGYYEWSLPDGFENLGDATGNKNAKSIRIKLISNNLGGQGYLLRVVSRTVCGNSIPAEGQVLWVNGGTNTFTIEQLPPTCGTKNLLFVVRKNGNPILPIEYNVNWSSTQKIQWADGIYCAVFTDVMGTLTATLSNACGTISVQRSIAYATCPNDDTGGGTGGGGGGGAGSGNDSVSVQKVNYSLTQLASKQQNNAIINFKLNANQAKHTVWLDRDSIAAGSSIVVNSIHLKPNPQQAVRPIVYLIDNQGNLLSMIDTLRPITPAKDTVQFSQCALRTYHKLRTGQYQVRLQYGKQVFFLPIFIYNATNTPPVGRVENELQPTTIQLENYPNPFSNETMIKYYLPQTTNGFLIIRNVMGEEIQSIAIQADKGWHEYPLNTAQWTNGLYFCTLYVEGKAITRKLLVIR